MSNPVSISVPRKISTIVSVGLWEVPIDIDEIAVSKISAPASAAFSKVATDKPVVAWVWILIGILVFFLIAVTKSNASKGFSKPAISLIQIESAPKSAYVLASSAYFSIV